MINFQNSGRLKKKFSKTLAHRLLPDLLGLLTEGGLMRAGHTRLGK